MALEQAVGASTYLGQRMMMGKRQASLGFQGGSQWLSNPVLVIVFATPNCSSSITLCVPLQGSYSTPQMSPGKQELQRCCPQKDVPERGWGGGGAGGGGEGWHPEPDSLSIYTSY